MSLEVSKKTIVVAEDNPINRELIRELLEARGYLVVEACDGREAFDQILQSPPDLLLADIQMPAMDGFVLLSKIRSHSSLQKLPVIALTAYAMEGDRDIALKKGFDGYITKPINTNSFAVEIERCLIKS